MKSPIRDPYYIQIEKALASHLDPAAFERAMGDLLRPDLPGLVPVPGGNDAGMDGAIADGEGEPFPLVCTTAVDVRRNLVKNLEQFKQRGLATRKVALATSQALTQKNRLGLFEAARDRGFTLLQVFAREAIADRLYHSSRWCQELLELTGQPSLLTAVPTQQRAFFDLKPVGREEDLAWLLQPGGDRILSAQPGAGKTFLLRYAIHHRSWPSLFLAKPDAPDAELANALRDQQPEVVIVDDAEVRTLQQLRRLRAETGLSFSILATTWPFSVDPLQEALGGSVEVRALELLARDEIVEVYRQLGVEADKVVMRYLVDQASNRPGLAATLASAWHRGDFSAVLLGAVLERNLAVQLEGLLGGEVRSTLALLALGGDLGLASEVVRKKLELAPAEFRCLVTGLAAGGVLRQGPQRELSVWPRALRWAVAKSQLFEPGKPQLIDPFGLLRELAGDDRLQPRQALTTLLNVRSLGGTVPSEFLYDWVGRFGSPDEWAALAMVGPAEAGWVLAQYPGDLLDVAASTLRHQLVATLERLLQKFAQESPQVPTNRRSHSAAAVLADWVSDLNQHQSEFLDRRRAILSAAQRGPDLAPEKAAELVRLVLHPGLERRSTDPGLGASVTIKVSALSPEWLQQSNLWQEARGLIKALDTPSWTQLASLLRELAEPGFSFGRSLRADMEAGFREFARQILADLAPLGRGNTAVTEGMLSLAERLGVELPLEPDELFRFLYPPPREDSEEPELSGVQDLAGQWARQEPVEVAALVARYQEASQTLNRHWPERLSAVIGELAATAERPEACCQAFLQAGLGWNLAAPFLERLLQLERTRYFELLTSLLEDPRHQRAAAATLICQEDVQTERLHRAIELLAQDPEHAKFLALRGEIPAANLLRILAGEDSRLAAAVAYGEWRREPPGQIRAELIEAWREAILNFEPAGRPPLNDLIEASFGDLLEADSELAFSWLQRRLAASPQEKPFLYQARDRSPWAKAALGLSREQRAELITSASWFPRQLLGRLVGEEPTLFELALQRQNLPERLEPLARKPDAAWEKLALTAVASGETPQSIAGATFPAEHSWWGSGAEYWTSWDLAFARFEPHPDPSLREVVRLGRQWLHAEIQAAREQERREALEGREP